MKWIWIPLISLSLWLPAGHAAEPAASSTGSSVKKAAPAARTGKTNPAAKADADQQQLKQRLIDHIDQRIRILQEARSCVERAASQPAVFLCYEEERQKTKALRKKDREGLKF